MPLTITEDGLRVWTYDNPDEFVANVCQRPGMYVGKTSLELVASYFYGYDLGVYDALNLKQNETAMSAEKTAIHPVAFSIWLCEECFFDTYGDAVGSAAGWAHFLAWLADSDAEAFVFMPVLYHEFTVALQEAEGSRVLRNLLEAVKLTSEERWALSAEDIPDAEEEAEEDETDDEEDNWEAERDSRRNALRVAARAVMERALQDAANGVDRPLAAHVATMRAAREAQKSRAAALLSKAAMA